MRRFRWKCGRIHIWQFARELSGGNQQKVVLAKWLSTKPRILILDEPTRGIDVGTKAAVHGLMSKLAAEGMAILMISSELPEVLGMSDRVIVMREGHVTAIFPAPKPRRRKSSPPLHRHVTTGSVHVTAQNPPAIQASDFHAILLWTLIRFREAGISLFILILMVAVTLRAPSFLTVDNFEDILLNISILAIVALAQTMVIITHGIDLSVSSMIGLVAMMVALS